MSIRFQLVMIYVVTSVTACISACVKSGGANQVAAEPPQVSVSQVIERRVRDWNEFTGRLQAIQKVEIRPRVSGYLDQVAFTEGKIVKQGDLLFVIDPRPYKADYDRASADVKRYKTGLELAQIELVRVQRLKDSGAVSEEEFDERESTVAQAESNVAGSSAALESASLNLSFTRVTSPIDGRVSRAEVTRSNFVTGGNNGGTLLLIVVSMDPTYLYFDGDEQTYLRYTQVARDGERPSSRDASNPVRVGLANEEGFPHPGIMDSVDNQLNPQTGTIRARAVLQNKDGQFTPGLFARVQLLGSAEYAAILIEDRAVNTQVGSDVRVFGSGDYAMRLWLDPGKIAARSMDVDEVLRALLGQGWGIDVS